MFERGPRTPSRPDPLQILDGILVPHALDVPEPGRDLPRTARPILCRERSPLQEELRHVVVERVLIAPEVLARDQARLVRDDVHDFEVRDGGQHVGSQRAAPCVLGLRGEVLHPVQGLGRVDLGPQPGGDDTHVRGALQWHKDGRHREHVAGPLGETAIAILVDVHLEQRQTGDASRGRERRHHAHEPTPFPSSWRR